MIDVLVNRVKTLNFSCENYLKSKIVLKNVLIMRISKSVIVLLNAAYTNEINNNLKLTRTCSFDKSYQMF